MLVSARRYEIPIRVTHFSGVLKHAQVQDLLELARIMKFRVQISRIGSLSIQGLSWTPYGSSGFTVKLFLLDILCLTILALPLGLRV
jgi:hypothetical protein